MAINDLTAPKATSKSLKKKLDKEAKNTLSMDKVSILFTRLISFLNRLKKDSSHLC
jgi:hypothetical protein